ncbi:MAG: hypothetical protein ACKVOQ_22610 [Cyclobacteriaceae bacterium]
MLKYKFQSKVIWEGEPARPLMKVQRPYQMLDDLSNGDLGTFIGVNKTIREIEKVVEGKKKKFSFGASDACIIDVSTKTSTIAYDFGEKEKEIPTKELLKLLKDWKEFLGSILNIH